MLIISYLNKMSFSIVSNSHKDRNRHINLRTPTEEILPSSPVKLAKHSSLLSNTSPHAEVSDLFTSAYKSTIDNTDRLSIQKASMFITETDCSKPSRFDHFSSSDQTQNLTNLISSCNSVQTSLVDIWSTAKKTLSEKQASTARVYKKVKPDHKSWIYEREYLEGKERIEKLVRAEKADCIANKIGLVDDLLTPKNKPADFTSRGIAEEAKSHVFISGKDLSNLETAKLIAMNKRSFAKKFDEVVIEKDKRYRLATPSSQSDTYDQKYNKVQQSDAKTKYEQKLDNIIKHSHKEDEIKQFIRSDKKQTLFKARSELRIPNKTILNLNSDRICSSYTLPELEKPRPHQRLNHNLNPRLDNYSLKTVSMLKGKPKQKIAEENQEIYEDIMNIIYSHKNGIKLST
jgi:hypothetical protein